jgi:hypothetical protein
VIPLHLRHRTARRAYLDDDRAQATGAAIALLVLVALVALAFALGWSARESFGGLP